MAVSRVGCGELFLHVHRSQLNPSVPVTSFQCRQTCTATTALDTPTLLRQVAIIAVPFKRALEYTRRRGTFATPLLRFCCVYREETRGKAALHALQPRSAGPSSEAEEWLWSSFRHYAYGERGPILVNEARKSELHIRKIS